MNKEETSNLQQEQDIQKSKGFRSHQDYQNKVEDSLKSLQNRIQEMNGNMNDKLQEMETRLHLLEDIYNAKDAKDAKPE